MNNNQENKGRNAALITVIVLLVIAFIALAYFIVQVFGIGRNVINHVENGSQQSNEVSVTHEKVISYDSQNLDLQLVTAHAYISPSTDGDIHISYSETASISFKLMERDGKITFEEHHNGPSFFGNICPPISVLLPENFSGKINCDTVSGLVSVKSLSKASSIEIDTISGDIELDSSSFSDSIELDTASGGIELFGCIGSRTELSSISGGISIDSLVCPVISLDTTSGTARLKGVDFTELEFDSVSGGLKGSVIGSEDEITVFFDSLSGSNSLKEIHGNGSKTIEFSSTSGSLLLELEDGTEAA